MVCVGADSIMAQARGVDLPTSVTKNILSDHIPLATCKPTEIWKLTKLTASGQTSDWGTLKKNFGIINALIEAGGGAIPHQKSLHAEFVAWLAENGIVWAVKDSERAIAHLRAGMQSLLSLKRTNEGKAPRKFPELQIIIDKLIFPSSTKDDVNMSAAMVPVPVASTHAMAPVPVVSTHATFPVPVASTQAMVPVDDDSDFGEEFQSKLFNVDHNPELPTPKPKPMLDPDTEFFPPSIQRWITPVSTPMSTPVRSNLMMHTAEKYTTEKELIKHTTPVLLNADELRRLSFQGPPIKAPLPCDYTKFGKAEESDADVDETVKRHRLHEKTDGYGKKCLAFPKPEIKKKKDKIVTKKKDKIVTKKKDKTVPEDLHPMVLE